MTDSRRDAPPVTHEDQPLRYEDIKRDLEMAGPAQMRKFNTDATLQRVINQELGLSGDIANKLFRWIGGREQLHLIRLLGQPAGGAEHEFALAFIRHAENIFTQLGDKGKEIRDIINGQTGDTTMFWTFAPYLLKVFRERGIGDEVALNKIFRWASKGVRMGQPGWEQFNLGGLEFLNETKPPTQYVLSSDPNHVSHRFTYQEAKRIADLLIGK